MTKAEHEMLKQLAAELLSAATKGNALMIGMAIQKTADWIISQRPKEE